MTDIFPLIILNARPAAGKSEILRALRTLDPEERSTRYHIGEIHVIDDFPMLWAWFEEDDILERELKRPRLHTTSDGYFVHQDLWHLLVRRLDLENRKWMRDSRDDATVLLEFSRGAGSGGYARAYHHLGEPLLSKACALYVQVSYEESLRKNRARFNPNRPDSIFEHGLSDEKMERLYRHDDWREFSAGDPAYLHVGQLAVPYVVFENEDDVTSQIGPPLYHRLEECLDTLWRRHIDRPRHE